MECEGDDDLKCQICYEIRQRSQMDLEALAEMDEMEEQVFVPVALDDVVNTKDDDHVEQQQPRHQRRPVLALVLLLSLLIVMALSVVLVNLLILESHNANKMSSEKKLESHNSSSESVSNSTLNSTTTKDITTSLSNSTKVANSSDTMTMPRDWNNAEQKNNSLADISRRLSSLDSFYSENSGHLERLRSRSSLDADLKSLLLTVLEEQELYRSLRRDEEENEIETYERANGFVRNLQKLADKLDQKRKGNRT